MRQVAAQLRAVALVAVACATTAACGARQTVPAIPAQVGAEQHGEATWYGNDFDGKRTASGEPFNQWAMTAAHRTLPFGTNVRVRNEQNGRTIVVRVNDRGPYGGGKRIIDLSHGAARALDMLRAGVIPVTLTVIDVPPPKPKRHRR